MENKSFELCAAGIKTYHFACTDVMDVMNTRYAVRFSTFIQINFTVNFSQIENFIN